MNKVIKSLIDLYPSVLHQNQSLFSLVEAILFARPDFYNEEVKRSLMVAGQSKDMNRKRVAQIDRRVRALSS